MSDVTRLPAPRLHAGLVIPTRSWRCALSDQDGPPLAFALVDPARPVARPILIAPHVLRTRLDHALAEVAALVLP